MTLEVLRGGKSELVVQHPDSLALRIPRAWTDADGAPPTHGTGTDTQLTVEAVRDLIHLANLLAARD
jgi:hypothetical protein